MLIKRGYLLLYYCFDLGDELVLDKIEKVLGRRPIESKLVCRRLSPDYLQYAIPPVYVKLKEKKIKGVFDAVEVSLKLYSFGVASLRYKIPIKGTFENLRELSFEFIGKSILESEAKKQMDSLFKELSEVIVRPAQSFSQEPYSVMHIQEFDEASTPQNILKKKRQIITSILKAEQKELGENEVADTLKNQLSYYPNDLIIIDWTATLMIDPEEAYDTLDIIEFAVIQLLELRTYDTYLDKKLEKAYDDIEKISGWKSIFLPAPKILNELLEVKLDVSEVIDKVENALKPIGDLYLAKVYTAAAKRFYLDSWKAIVKSKLDTLQNTYSNLAHKVELGRTLLLETMIVALFVIDILIYFVF